MLVIYEGPDDGVRLAPVHGDIWMQRGQPVEVPDDLGERLCEQPHYTAAPARRRRRRMETPERPTASETPDAGAPATETPERPDAAAEVPESIDQTMEARHGTEAPEAR